MVEPPGVLRGRIVGAGAAVAKQVERTVPQIEMQEISVSGAEAGAAFAQDGACARRRPTAEAGGLPRRPRRAGAEGRFGARQTAARILAAVEGRAVLMADAR